MYSSVLQWPRVAKRLIVVALDIMLALLATWLAFTLRLDVLHRPMGWEWWVYVLAPTLAIPVFVRFGLYRAIFRYTGQAAMVATAKAVGISGGLLALVLVWQRWPGVPRSLGVLQPLIFLVLVATSRTVARVWLASLASSRQRAEGRLLVYGSGTAAVQTATAMNISGQYVLVGFLTDDPAMAGRSLNGVPVFASHQAAAVVTEKAVTDIVLALPGVSRAERNQILGVLRPLPVHIRTLPSWADLASGRITASDLRELDVEDLLGRLPVSQAGDLLTSHLSEQVILVTGAGGSIGSELCRQIIFQGPTKVVLFDHNEFGLYEIHQELADLCSVHELKIELVPVLGSVANFLRLQATCRTFRPSIIYHAAAYKHVPLVESNGSEGIANNVLGTLKLARAAIESSVSRFVLISTDKAVRPTNVMGASKRMAELVLQALADHPSAKNTCFTMVRFGNVLGSSGSVVPLFRKQIESGGPITLTHPDVTRYFMTIPEAAQLVLQAGAMASGGDVFLLDMGEPVRIKDLALRMVRLSGLTVKDEANPEGDIAIEITGLRPGEKLYEELLIGDNPQPTAHARIMRAREQFLSWDQLSPILDELSAAVDADDFATLQVILIKHVQGYASPKPVTTSAFE